jgi:hypothetical protein
MSNEIEQQLVNGFQNAKNMFAYELALDALELEQRDTWVKVLASVAGASGVGYYYGASMNQLGIKSLYAALATGLGLNVGNARLTTVSTAGIYWLVVGASAYLNVTNVDSSRMYEAVAIAAFGLVADMITRPRDNPEFDFYGHGCDTVQSAYPGICKDPSGGGPSTRKNCPATCA